MRRLHFQWAVASLVLSLCAPDLAGAQAWLPAANEGSVTITYQGLFSRDHLDWKGDPFDKGSVSSNTMLLGFEYGLTDLLSMDAKVAFVANKHEGIDRLHGPLDTGIYHGTIQDARVALAFRVPLNSRLAIAPYAAGIIPTHNYETRGHSAPGRKLKALQVGTWVGRDLSPILPKAYVQGQVAHAFVERVNNMNINRTHLDFEGGYAVSSFLTVTVAGAVQRTHDGVTFPLPQDEHLHEVAPIHDRIAKDNYFVMNFGATVGLTRKMAMYGSFVRTMWGENTHHVKGVIFGTSWTFGDTLSLGARPTVAPGAWTPKPGSRVRGF